MQFQGQVDFICYILPRARTCRKVFGLSQTHLLWHWFVQHPGKILELESVSQDLGGFPLKSYETVRRKTQTEENRTWENE